MEQASIEGVPSGTNVTHLNPSIDPNLARETWNSLEPLWNPKNLLSWNSELVCATIKKLPPMLDLMSIAAARCGQAKLYGAPHLRDEIFQEIYNPPSQTAWLLRANIPVIRVASTEGWITGNSRTFSNLSKRTEMLQRTQQSRDEFLEELESMEDESLYAMREVRSRISAQLATCKRISSPEEMRILPSLRVKALRMNIEIFDQYLEHTGNLIIEEIRRGFRTNTFYDAFYHNYLSKTFYKCLIDPRTLEAGNQSCACCMLPYPPRLQPNLEVDNSKISEQPLSLTLQSLCYESGKDSASGITDPEKKDNQKPGILRKYCGFLTNEDKFAAAHGSFVPCDFLVRWNSSVRNSMHREPRGTSVQERFEYLVGDQDLAATATIETAVGDLEEEPRENHDEATDENEWAGDATQLNCPNGEHIICVNCLVQWFMDADTCPLCRFNFPTDGKFNGKTWPCENTVEPSRSTIFG